MLEVQIVEEWFEMTQHIPSPSHSILPSPYPIEIGEEKIDDEQIVVIVVPPSLVKKIDANTRPKNYDDIDRSNKEWFEKHHKIQNIQVQI